MTPIVVVILASIACSVGGQLSLKSGMNRVGRVGRNAPTRWSRGLPMVLVGLSFYAISTLLWLYTLSRVDLSFAFPFLSLSFVAILIGARIGLGESLGASRLVGCAFIVVGVLVVSISHVSQDSGPGGATEWRDNGRRVVLVLATDWGEHATPKGASVDPSAEWSNLLTHTFGSCDIRPASDLVEHPNSVLAQRDLVVLPRRVLNGLSLAIRDTLDRRVSRGEFLVLAEAPNEAWATALGLRTAAVETRQFLPWTYDVRSSFLRGPGLPPPPTRIPIPWSVWRYAPDRAMHPSTRPSATLAGRSALWNRPVGRGAWIVLNFDLADLAYRMRQAAELVDAAGPLAEPWLDAWCSAALRPEAAPLPWPRLESTPFGLDAWVLQDSAMASNDGLGSSTLPYRALDSRGRLIHEWTIPRFESTRTQAWNRWNVNGLRGPTRAEAQGQNLVTTSISEFLEWWASRQRLGWRWHWDDPWLSIDFDAEKVDRPFAIALARQWRRRALVDWQSTAASTRSGVGWRFEEEVLRLEVPPGGGTLRVRYEPIGR